jgi:hypothetical protein
MDWASLATIVLNGLATASGLFIFSSGLDHLESAASILPMALYMLGAYVASSMMAVLADRAALFCCRSACSADDRRCGSRG